ncbi:hypothetical protein IGI04_020943 [Brassica rapa subsp. trilocularis]|uniref:Uncharacterized protein n=1 Tax=Brassica rapa subsp. trilocularis TaxID=1813537 RepID=A0ABQ7MK62_BRACM|nr:hypothetical protein IGI04_020943 [Brassica rapa subsp. trilocularis]
MAKRQALLVNMRNKIKELEVKMAETSLTNEDAMEEKQLCDSIAKVRVPMGKAFSNFNFVTIINLNYTNLENEGTIALVNALENSAPSLKAIEMAGNNITYEAAPDIAACLVAKKHLKRLNLSNNDLKDEGCFEIAYIMEPLEVKYVDMSSNNLTREGALSLALVAVKKEVEIWDYVISNSNAKGLLALASDVICNSPSFASPHPFSQTSKTHPRYEPRAGLSLSLTGDIIP